MYTRVLEYTPTLVAIPQPISKIYEFIGQAHGPGQVMKFQMEE